MLFDKLYSGQNILTSVKRRGKVKESEQGRKIHSSVWDYQREREMDLEGAVKRQDQRKE